MALFDQFPYTNMHEINLDWVISQIKTLVADWQSFDAEMRGKYQDLVDYVNNYFNDLDLSDEIREVLDQMIEDGSFSQIIAEAVAEIIGGGINFYGAETSHNETETGDYWLVKIPKISTTGERLELKVGISDDTVTSPQWVTDPQTVEILSIQHKASFAVNGGFAQRQNNLIPWGSVIIDGEILLNQYDTHTSPVETIGIMADGSWRFYDSQSVNAVEMKEDGVMYAVAGLGAIVNEGAATANLAIWANNYSGGNWQSIGQNDNYYFIITTEPRRAGKTGITLTEIAQLYLSLGATQAYVLDSGGSCSTNIESIKINSNEDDYGLTDRKVATFLYIRKPDITESPETDQDVSISRALGLVLSSIRSSGAMLKQYSLSATTGEFADADLLPLNSVAYTYANSVNVPGPYYHIFTYGYSNSMKVQIAIRHTDANMKIRSVTGSTWTAWKDITSWEFPTTGSAASVNDLPPMSVYLTSSGDTDKPDTGRWLIATLGSPSSAFRYQIAVKDNNGAIASRFRSNDGTYGPWAFSLTAAQFRAEILPSVTVTGIDQNNTRNLADLGIITAAGYYFVIINRPGNNGDSASAFVIHYSGSSFNARTNLYVSSLVSGATLSSDGIIKPVSSNTAQTYMVKAFKID